MDDTTFIHFLINEGERVICLSRQSKAGKLIRNVAGY